MSIFFDQQRKLKDVPLITLVVQVILVKDKRFNDVRCQLTTWRQKDQRLSLKEG